MLLTYSQRRTLAGMMIILVGGPLIYGFFTNMDNPWLVFAAACGGFIVGLGVLLTDKYNRIVRDQKTRDDQVNQFRMKREPAPISHHSNDRLAPTQVINSHAPQHRGLSPDEIHNMSWY